MPALHRKKRLNRRPEICAVAALFCFFLYAAWPSASHAEDDELIFDLPPAATETIDVENQKETGDEMEERAGLLLEYFERCMDFIYTDLSIDTRIAYCACTGEKLDSGFSTDEIFTMAKGEGKPVDEMKLTLDVYVPCLSYPARETERYQCYKVERTNFYSSAEIYESVCNCWGEGAANYLKNYGRDLAAMLFAKLETPPDDLLVAIQRSREYKSEWERWRSKCRNEYAFQ